MKQDAGLLRIGELERLSGVPRYTIHQYVRNGLLPQPVKTGKTMAYYNRSHLEQLQSIREIKGTSKLPLAFLKKLLEDRESTNTGIDAEAPAAVAGKPKPDIKEKRKQQIKEAAFKVFLEKGFQHARIHDITTTAGISTGTFYIYYRDKRELFMEVIDALIRDTIMPAEKALEKKGDVLKVAVATARYYMDNYDYFSRIVNQLRGMMAEEEPQARDKFIALHNQLANPIMREIQTAISKGLIRDVDPELFARSLMGIVEFLSFRLTFDDKYTSGEAVSFMIDLVMNGVGKA